LALLAAAAPASAAVTIGPNPLPARSGVITSGGARIFTNSALPGAALASPIDGVVVRWRVRRGSGPGVLQADTITLRILRPTGVMDEFTAMGTSDAHAVPGGSSDPIDVYEYPTRLPIATGDRLGLGTTASSFAEGSAINAAYLTRVNALADGQSATFTPGLSPDAFALINADIEPDCDRDGFGDETQDPLIPPVVGCDLIAPQTTIAKGGKKLIETHHSRAKVKFSFSSDEVGSTFECKLDRKPFKPCSSPKRYRIKATEKAKKHTLRVEAIDPAGNKDATPAKRSFKVERLA
jgi:hypothetical protein